MASYTDAITQFNPYIQTLPVEAMVKVGMQKQALYDEGIQKVQTQIDNVAGLDIMKGPTKNYLQSKLNELGNNLTSVAAADFSNYQVVNSVGGMAKQLIKDSTIQNGVSSTAFARKQMAIMSAHDKEGKSSSQNKTLFNTQLSKWLNDGDVNSSFSSEYKPYIDLTKKWTDLQDKLGASEYSVDLPFLQDDKGRYIDQQGNLLPAGAKPIPNTVMIEKIFKGKSPQAIKNAIMASMTEDDIQQLNIDGWYHYKDTPVDALKGIADSKQKEHVDKLNEYLSGLQTYKGLNPKDVKYQASVDNMIKDAKTDYEASQKAYLSTIDLISKNPDAYRSEIYSQHAINEFSTNMSNLTESVKYIANPYKEQEDKERTYQLSLDKYKLDNWKAKDESNRGWETIRISKEKADADKKKNALMTDGGLALSVATNVIKPTEEAFIKGLEDDKEAMASAKSEFRKSFKNTTDAEFNKNFAFYESEYNKGHAVPGEYVDYFDSYKTMSDSYNRNSAMLVSIQKEATDSVKNSDTYKQSLINAEAFIKNMGGDTPITLESKWRHDDKYVDKKTITPRQMIADLISGKAHLQHLSGNWEYVDGDVSVQVPSTTGNDVGPAAARPTFRKIIEYGKLGYFDINKKANNTITSIVNKKISEKAVNYQGKAQGLNTSGEGNREFVQNQVGLFLNRIETDDKGYQETHPLIKNWSLTDAKALLIDPATKFGTITQGNEVYITMLGKGADGKIGNIQYIATNQKEFKDVFGEGTKSPVQDVSDIIFQNGNTNMESQTSSVELKNNPNSYKTSYFSKRTGGSAMDNFPRIKNYNIKADIVKYPTSGKFETVFYIEDPKTREWKTYPSAESFDLNAMVSQFSMMDDATVKQLLK